MGSVCTKGCDEETEETEEKELGERGEGKGCHDIIVNISYKYDTMICISTILI